MGSRLFPPTFYLRRHLCQDQKKLPKYHGLVVMMGDSSICNFEPVVKFCNKCKSGRG